MKLGLGLYRAMLTRENFRFARQAGATHIVAHITNYFAGRDLTTASKAGEPWGYSDRDDAFWTYEYLRDLRQAMNAEGVELAAVENFNPAHWYDVLLDGPRKREQLEWIKGWIRAMGKAGVPCMGYNFSIAGVWGRTHSREARGGAESVCVVEAEMPEQTPIPQGVVWNMIYDRQASPGTVPPVTHDQLWQRLGDFLHEIVPVAEEAGVMLAAHPDDPPFDTLRGTARLVNTHAKYQRLLDVMPSRHSGMEFCLGTLGEMPEGDIYDTIDRYSRTGRIGYIHFRNIRGKIPNYHEVFIDEGDIDMIRALRILHRNGYKGVLIPDHTPAMTCDAPWHAGMAFALGYMGAALKIIQG